jgi:hypothetical protein
MTMMVATPSKQKPSKEEHSSPRSVGGLVLDEPEHFMEQEALQQPKTRTRMQELEEKRLKLRRQCASLQQQLHVFSARTCETEIKVKPERHSVQPAYMVENVFWCDDCGEAVNTGPLNSRKMPHGERGRMTYEDGSIIEGDFKDGKPHGEARYQGSDGCSYEGKLVHSSRSESLAHLVVSNDP